MRHTILKYLSVSLMTCLLLSSLTLTSCDTSDEASGEVILKAFGPSPALRGGELEFIGLNLDKVTSILLPENIEVTEITVISPAKIKMVIPQEAKPGKVVLKTADKEIETLTNLTFSEPISIDHISPLNIKAGQEFTITGDYLNLIAGVIFNDGVVVDSAHFVSKSRYQIKVLVPIEAQSGKVIITNGAEIPILVYSDTTINVTLPTITAMTPNPVKPGATLTVTGTDIQLVKGVIFADNLSDTVLLNQTATSFTVNVPANIQEGRFKLVAYSDVEVTSAADLQLISPVITNLSATTLKTGDDLTLTGTDLDLVTGVVFGGGSTGTIKSQSATSIVVTPPTNAVDGAATLTTRSGKSVTSAALTFVKPVITTITPLAITAGDVITITGTDLDLVKQVLFAGDQSVTITPSAANATSLTVETPDACTSGTITLVALNDVKVVSSDALSVTPANKPVITSVPAEVKRGTALVLRGKKLNLVESVEYADGTKVTDFGTRTATMLEINIPATTAVGTIFSLKLKAFDGRVVTTSDIKVLSTDPITSVTKMVMDFNTRTTDWHGVDWDNWGSSYDAASSKANGYITLVSRPGWWVIGCNHADPNGGWVSVNTADYVLKVDMKTATPIKITGAYEFQFMIGGETISSTLLVSGDYITTDGEWATLTLPISTLTSPTKNSGNFGIVLNGSDAATDFAGLSFDNIRFEPK
jgi:hypothetical protein